MLNGVTPGLDCDPGHHATMRGERVAPTPGKPPTGDGRLFYPEAYFQYASVTPWPVPAMER